MKSKKVEKIYYSANQKLSKHYDEKWKRLLKLVWDGSFRYSLWKVIKISGKSFNQVLKFDLWEEVSKERSEVKRLDYYIHNLIDFRKLFYIEIVSKFCQEYNKMKLNNEYVVNGDITKLPFKKHSFDLIIDFSTTDHIENKKLDSTFKKINNSLKKHGIYIIYHLNNDYFNINDWNSGYSTKFFPSFARSIDEIKQLLIKNNFTILDYEFFFPFFIDNTLFISQRVKNMSWLIEKFFPRRLLYSFMNSRKLNILFYIIAKS